MLFSPSLTRRSRLAVGRARASPGSSRCFPRQSAPDPRADSVGAARPRGRVIAVPATTRVHRGGYAIAVRVAAFARTNTDRLLDRCTAASRRAQTMLGRRNIDDARDRVVACAAMATSEAQAMLVLRNTAGANDRDVAYAAMAMSEAQAMLVLRGTDGASDRDIVCVAMVASEARTMPAPGQHLRCGGARSRLSGEERGADDVHPGSRGRRRGKQREDRGVARRRPLVPSASRTVGEDRMSFGADGAASTCPGGIRVAATRSPSAPPRPRSPRPAVFELATRTVEHTMQPEHALRGFGHPASSKHATCTFAHRRCPARAPRAPDKPSSTARD
jgi:hypothetical protein